MSAIPSVAAPAAPVSYFPDLGSVGETYKSVMQRASQEYQAHFEKYCKKADELPVKIKEWAQRNEQLTNPSPSMDALKEEYKRKLLEYVEYQDLREGIQKLYKTYESTFLYCDPPTLDLHTLQVLDRLGVKSATIKLVYDKAFTATLGALNVQKDKIKELYERVMTQMRSLKSNLEPLGRLCSEARFYQTVFRRTLTPYVTYDIDIIRAAREAKNAEEKK